MITKGQAQYLKVLIERYADAEADSYKATDAGDYEGFKLARATAKEVERKLDNYIAKLTETGK